MDFINFYLIPGIVLGSIYALGAIGVSLVFGILRFANFAHGELMLIGAYVTYSLIQFTGLHPLVVLPIAMLFTSLVALGIDHSFYKPFRASKSTIVIVASFGIALMARSAVQIIWVSISSPIRLDESKCQWCFSTRYGSLLSTSG